MKKSWINNKTIILTGVTSGIGRELCKKLIVSNNCTILGIGRSKEKIESLKEELKDKKDNLKPYLFDVSEEKNWIKFCNEIQDIPCDILINNAGILPPFETFENLCNKERIEKETFVNDIQKVMKTNFMSAVMACGYLDSKLRESSTPAIINISSSSALCPLPGISIYSASKSAIKNFTECLILEKNYYVSLICPGFTKSDIFRYQKCQTKNKLIDMVSSSLDKMTNKIYKAICKKKKRCVFGIDAKWMDRLYRLAPKKSPRLFGKILKKSKIELFKDVFDYNEKGSK